MALSRRHFFHLATLAAGTIGSASLVQYAAAETSANKPPKQAVGYQDQPNGDQRCSLCANFVAPADCRVVTGPVAPAGWCHLFQPRKL